MDVPVYIRVYGHEKEVVEGPVGFLRKGAHVYVQENLGASDDYLSVGTTFPIPSTEIITTDRGFRLWEMNVLVPRMAVPRQWSKMAGDADSLDWGYYRTLLLRPDGIPFSMALCGRLRKLGQRSGHLFVAAEYPTGELWGWMRQKQGSPVPPNGRGEDFGCHHAIPEGHPADYESADSKAFEQTPLEQRMVQNDEFYFVRHTDADQSKLECKRVVVAKGPRKEDTIIHFMRADGSIEETRRLSRKDNHVYLGSEGLAPNGDAIRPCGRIGAHLRAVRDEGDSIGFLEYGSSTAERDSVVLSYHPRLLIWWDRSPEQCQERLRRGEDAFAPYD